LELRSGDRIEILLSEEALLDKDVERRREGIRVLALKESDGVCVLLTPEDQLRFAFALRQRAPRRQGRAEHDRHDAQANKQGDHGIPIVAPRFRLPPVGEHSPALPCHALCHRIKDSRSR
jgi:hypothetical protein